MRKKIIFVVLVTVCIAILPVNSLVYADESVLEMNLYSAYMCDYDTGTELYSKNKDEKHEIASMVKIMTALLVFEEIQKGNILLEDKVVISNNAASMIGSEMFLDSNESYSISDLLKGLIVVSANDSAVALAEHIDGSEMIFTERMNKRAKELGAINTLYVNCTGLPSSEKQYSTAKDVSIINRELTNHIKYYDYAQIWLEDYMHPSGRITQLVNTNKLIRHYKGCISGKTGYTDNAKYCLSAVAERNSLKLITTVMGCDDSKTRFASVSKMFNYAFANYSNFEVCKRNEIIENNIIVEKGEKKSIELEYAKDYSLILKNNENKPEVTIELPNTVKAPIKKGDIIGRAIIISNDRKESVDIISKEDINRLCFWDQIKDITKNWQIEKNWEKE